MEEGVEPLIVSEELLYISTLILALVFTILSLNVEMTTGEGPRVKWGDVSFHVRAIIYPLFASASWGIMFAFSYAVNNCYFTFGSSGAACYSDPNFLNVTSTVVGDPAANDILSWLFLLFCITMGLVFVFAIVTTMGKDLAESVPKGEMDL
jgi:hypothetical protein